MNWIFCAVGFGLGLLLGILISSFKLKRQDKESTNLNIHENIDSRIINAKEIIDLVKKGDTGFLKNNKKLLTGLKMIAKEPNWEKQIDDATLNILSDLNIKRKQIEKNNKSSKTHIAKIDKKNSHVRNEPVELVEYVTESYWYNLEDGSFDLNENPNPNIEEDT